MNVLSAGWRFPLMLALLLAALLVLVRPSHQGDVVEYSLTTIALASHASPDIRLQDLERGKQLLPELAGPYALLEEGMRNPDAPLYAAFSRGQDGKVYAVHFFGYAALAALPYLVLEKLGLPPFKCFQIVNLAAIFLLGLAMHRLFGSSTRAMLGVGLFMLCGGFLYWTWSSPECVSAAALLAGLIFYTHGAPLAGAVLAGLAAQQNPTIVVFFGFAPLLQACLAWQAGAKVRAAVAQLFQPRYLLALAAGVAVFLLPVLFNMLTFGVPNIIAKRFSDPGLISLTRLASFYFDLNQGMIVGIPAVLAALALWAWPAERRARRHALLVLCCCALLTLALALPALAVLNWNSGAAGVMRYAFWAAMPLVFVLLLRMRQQARWPLAIMAALLAGQAAAMANARSYGYVEFSPLARTILKYAPGLYHPEPEIFAERMAGNDDYIQPHKVYVRTVNGQAVTTLYNSTHPGIQASLCGSGGELAGDNAFADSVRGWRYIDGPVRCAAGGAWQQSFQHKAFVAGDNLRLLAGWSSPEANGPGWDGVWSDGARSALTLTLPAEQAVTQVSLIGNYFGDNRRTRVTVNGKDLGWQQLDQGGHIALPEAARGTLQVTLDHDAPKAPGGADTRKLALFLREVTLR